MKMVDKVLHANFKLSNLERNLILSNSDSVVIDSVSYLPQNDDVSFGRSPNGIGSFNMLTPTFKVIMMFQIQLVD